MGVNLKLTGFWRKFIYIFTFSFTVEVLQFVFAIGATDINDVIMNTLGGFTGLSLCTLGYRYLDNRKLDQFIVIAITLLLILLILFRVLVLKVRY